VFDGKKVKINAEWTTAYRANPVFLKFVKANKDKVFTAHLAWGYTTLYTLDEDDSPVKWLFSEQSLIGVED